MKGILTAFISLILTAAMLFDLAGCTNKEQKITDPEETDIAVHAKPQIRITRPSAVDLMKTVTANERPAAENIKEKSEIFTDFALRLFKECEKKGENILISPLSVLCALSVTANGAKKNTLSEMEKVLGMTSEELNEYVYSYMNILSNTENCKLSLANSIWFTDDERFTVNKEFLQKNADYYNADIYKAPFNNSTRDDINNWVYSKTDGMIDNILDEIPPEAIMYLVNALAFDAKWENEYEKYRISNGIFTTEDKRKTNAEFMYSNESIYLEDENAVGFAKYYKERKYAFAALLPDKGVSVSEYIASLDGEKLHNILTYSDNITVDAAIPKFESSFDIEMSEVLKKMGMEDAFSGLADFSGLGTSSMGNIFISRVLHKTYISVDENGTKAGAATVVETVDECCPVFEDIKTVHLNRPFLYMLIDCETNIPFFIGTVMEV